MHVWRGGDSKGHSTFLGGCVLHGFPKVGYKEQIFLKKWGSWEQKFGSSELKFLPNKAKNVKKKKKNPKIENEGQIDGKLVG